MWVLTGKNTNEGNLKSIEKKGGWFSDKKWRKFLEI